MKTRKYWKLLSLFIFLAQRTNVAALLACARSSTRSRSSTLSHYRPMRDHRLSWESCRKQYFRIQWHYLLIFGNCLNLPEVVIYVSIYFKFTGDLLNVTDLLPTKFRGDRLIFCLSYKLFNFLLLADRFLDHTVIFF